MKELFKKKYREEVYYFRNDRYIDYIAFLSPVCIVDILQFITYHMYIVMAM